MTTSSSTPALPIAAISVERFVERLYAPLAWEATVRLGDPAIASRLVERVLHRAWDERERFATFDALYRHVQDAALVAITAEAERRRDVTRFDGDLQGAPEPGSLESMSLDAVRRRIGEGRKPAATPPSIAALASPASSASSAERGAVGAPTASPAPARLVSEPTRAAAAPERPVHKPRLSIGRDARAGAVPRSSGPVARSSGPLPRPSGTAARHTGSFAPFPSSEPRFKLDEQQKRLAIGAAVLLVIFAVLALLKGGSSGDPRERAIAALADTAGVSHRTARAVVQDVVLPDSSLARLGASASLGANRSFGDGARALRLAGPVSVSLRRDSTALTAITYGDHRFLTAGAVAAFATDAGGHTLVQVDSGDLVLWRDSSRVRLIEGSIVRIGEGTPMPLTRDQRDAAFGWRLGRLRLSGESLKAIAAAARQWYDVDLRYPAERAQTDTASLDVPLASRDSLVDALQTALRARAEVTGDRIVLRSAPSATTQERPARAPRVPALSAPVFTAPTLLDPRIPPER